MSKTIRLVSCLLMVFAVAHNSDAQEGCGDVFKVSTGPWDYSDPRNHGIGEGVTKNTVKVVERRHFTDNVRLLIKGESSSEVFPDLAYTLNHIPNHYPALMSLIEYDAKHNGELPQLDKYPFRQSVQCYFSRALQFKPEDRKIIQLYGIYFYRNGNYERAIQQFELANKDVNSPELNYNLGLAYLAIGELEKAKAFADKAYGQNFPLPGLRDKLQREGVSFSGG